MKTTVFSAKRLYPWKLIQSGNEPSTTWPDFQVALKDILDRNNISQAQLARKLKFTSPMTISHWRANHTLPTDRTLSAIAEALGEDINALKHARDVSRCKRNAPSIFREVATPYNIAKQNKQTDSQHTPPLVAHDKLATTTLHTFTTPTPSPIPFIKNAHLICRKKPPPVKGDPIVVLVNNEPQIGNFDPALHDRHTCFRITAILPLALAAAFLMSAFASRADITLPFATNAAPASNILALAIGAPPPSLPPCHTQVWEGATWYTHVQDILIKNLGSGMLSYSLISNTIASILFINTDTFYPPTPAQSAAWAKWNRSDIIFRHAEVWWTNSTTFARFGTRKSAWLIQIGTTDFRHNATISIASTTDF